MRGALLLLVFAACAPPDEGPWMDPGTNCQTCHRAGGTGPAWSVSGTLFETSESEAGAAGVTIHVTDRNGQVLSITSNGAGNFYTAEELALPVRIVLEANGRRVQKPGFTESGSCNACHRSEGDGAAGKLARP